MKSLLSPLWLYHCITTAWYPSRAIESLGNEMASLNLPTAICHLIMRQYSTHRASFDGQNLNMSNNVCADHSWMLCPVWLYFMLMILWKGRLTESKRQSILGLVFSVLLCVLCIHMLPGWLSNLLEGRTKLVGLCSAFVPLTFYRVGGLAHFWLIIGLSIIDWLRTCAEGLSFIWRKSNKRQNIHVVTHWYCRSDPVFFRITFTHSCQLI